MTGLTVTRPGGGYSPVCLTCERRLMVTVRLRSHALTALADHHAHACPGALAATVDRVLIDFGNVR